MKIVYFPWHQILPMHNPPHMAELQAFQKLIAKWLQTNGYRICIEREHTADAALSMYSLKKWSLPWPSHGRLIQTNLRIHTYIHKYLQSHTITNRCIHTRRVPALDSTVGARRHVRSTSSGPCQRTRIPSTADPRSALRPLSCNREAPTKSPCEYRERERDVWTC